MPFADEGRESAIDLLPNRPFLQREKAHPAPSVDAYAINVWCTHLVTQ